VLGRILQMVKPQRIVLFGSAARGELKTDSDLDILVIVRGPVHRKRAANARLLPLGRDPLRRRGDGVPCAT